jgi:hypothetical protein
VVAVPAEVTVFKQDDQVVLEVVPVVTYQLVK